MAEVAPGKLWVGRLKVLAAAVAALVLFRDGVYDVCRVPSGSMLPTLVVGDRVWVNRLAYGLRVPYTSCWVTPPVGPGRGDVVVFHAPGRGGLFVKRVVGLPGERVEVRGREVRVGGASLGEDGRAYRVQYAGPTEDFGPVVVPPGHYFLLGDNRDHSRDSREFGCVSAGAVLGRVTGVAFSLEAGAVGRPRWSRFGAAVQ